MSQDVSVDYSPHLQNVSNHRKFWRPIIKLFLGDGLASCILTSLIFLALLALTVPKRLSSLKLAILSVLMLALELSGDVSVALVTGIFVQNFGENLMQSVFYFMTAILMKIIENYLWFGVTRQFEN